MFHRLTLLLCLLVSAFSAAARTTDPAQAAIDALAAQPESSIDLLEAAYLIERRMHPALDRAALFREVDDIVAHIRRGWPGAVGPEAQLLVLMDYLYKPGPWNGHRPYRFDFDDPWGKQAATRMVSGLLKTRRGNCVSMPLLVVILGQRLGMDIRLAKAQRHYYARFRKNDGTWINVEATSGGGISDERLIRENEISDVAVRKGTYMRGLSRRETVATMLNSLMLFQLDHGRNAEAVKLGMSALRHDPKSVEAMLSMASGYYRMLKADYLDKYASPADIPPDKRAEFQRLSNGNLRWAQSARDLGWREASASWHADHLDSIKQSQPTTGKGGSR